MGSVNHLLTVDIRGSGGNLNKGIFFSLLIRGDFESLCLGYILHCNELYGDNDQVNAIFSPKYNLWWGENH